MNEKGGSGQSRCKVWRVTYPVLLGPSASTAYRSEVGRASVLAQTRLVGRISGGLTRGQLLVVLLWTNYSTSPSSSSVKWVELSLWGGEEQMK